ncbi:MAG: hypothetical protein WCI79_00090 [Candidatus Saccharibacteria bacterium]
MEEIKAPRKINTNNNMRLDVIYADREFKVATRFFKEDLVKYLIDKGYFELPEHFTYCSKTLLDRLCDKKIIDKYNNIIKKFNISDNELWVFLGLSTASHRDSSISIDLTADKEYVTINIYPWAKQEDLKSSWCMIEKLLKTRKGYVGKLRGPKDIKLIYAVAKALSNDMGYKDIAKLINDDLLKGYRRPDGDKKTWSGPELTEHFNRYKYILFK